MYIFRKKPAIQYMYLNFIFSRIKFEYFDNLHRILHMNIPNVYSTSNFVCYQQNIYLCAICRFFKVNFMSLYLISKIYINFVLN